MSESTVGMMKAAERFGPTKACSRLSTAYAAASLLGRLLREDWALAVVHASAADGLKERRREFELSRGSA